MEKDHVANFQGVQPFQRFPETTLKASLTNEPKSRIKQFECGKLLPKKVEVKKKNWKRLDDFDSFDNFEQTPLTQVDPSEWKTRSTNLWKQNQVRGQMHSNDTRVTLIFGNIDWFSFTLKDTCAYSILAHSDKNKDSNTSTDFVKVGDRLHICTNFCYHDIKNDNIINESYNKLTCNLIDLDGNEGESGETQDQIKQKLKSYDLYFTRIPRDFCPGVRKQTKVRITQILHSVVGQQMSLNAAYFYRSQQTNQNGLLFTSFEKKLSQNQLENDKLVKRGASFHSSQVILENQYIINYPMIMYKTYHPQNNILMISNFAVNQPQKLIDLGSYRFLCFVDSSIPQEQTWREKGETCICFLVLTPLGTVRLMYYRTFAWTTENTNIAGYPSERQNNVQLVSGNLVIDQSYEFSHVKKAALLLKADTQNHAQVILQSFGNVLGVNFKWNLEKSQKLSQINLLDIIDQDQSMVPLEILFGQNRAYCLQRSMISGDEIIIIGFNQLSHQITKQVIYQQKAPILNMQLNYGDMNNSQTQLGIYIIDHEFQFKFIAPQQSQLHFTQKLDLSSRFEVKLQIDLGKQDINYLFEDLVALPWQGIQISPRSVIAARQADKTAQSEKYKRFVYNINSHTRTEIDYLDYNHDEEKQNRQNKTIHDLRQVPWIGKFILVVQEAKSMYFLVEEDIEERRVDLMNVDQTRELVRDIFVLDSKIIVQLDYFCLIFNQHNMLLSEVLQMPKETGKDGKTQSKQNPINTTLPNPFGYRGKQYVEHDGLLYCYSINEKARLVRSAKVAAVCEIIKAKLKKCNIDFQGTTPNKYVSPSGTTSFLYKVNTFDPESKIQESNQLQLQKIAEKVETNLRGEQMKLKGLEEVVLTKIELFLDEEGRQVQANTKCRLDLDEQRYIIYCIISKKLDENVNFKDLQILLTRDYLIINAQTEIHFIRKNQVLSFDESTRSFSKVMLKTIYLSNLLQGDLSFHQSGVKIYSLEEEDFETVSQTTIRSNCIQISFADEHIMWDLDHNEEVSYLLGQSQFLTEEDYVRTGFRLHVPVLNQRLKPKIKNSYPITTNWDQSLVGINRISDSGEPLRLCFKTFTKLDLFEMQNIEKLLESQKPIKRVDLESVFANVYGRTLFSLFFDSPEVANVVQRMFDDQTLEPFLDDKHVEFDNILIRKLFRVLILPARYGDASRESLVFRLHIKGEWTNEPLQQYKEPEKLSVIGKIYRSISTVLIKSLLPGQHGKDIDVRDHHNLLSLGLNKGRQAQLDSYLDLMMLSKEARFANVIQEYGHFKKILNISSSQAKDFLNNSFMTTEMCSGIDQVLWDPKKKIEVFGARSSLLSEEHILRKYNRKADLNDKQLHNRLSSIKGIRSFLPGGDDSQMRKFCGVQVRIIEIEWVSQYLRDFFVYMAKLQNVDLYDNELIKVLLQQQDYSSQLLIFGFVPFCIYMGLCQYYFTYILTDAIPTGPTQVGYFEGSSRDVTIRVFILILTILFFFVELFQAMYLRIVYFSDIWNYIYTGSFILNLVIVCQHSRQENNPNKLSLVQTASIASIILWFMLYYWMRIFQATAFYVLIIQETLKDIRPFLFIFMIIICCFGNAINILDQYGQFDLTNRVDTELLIPPFIDRTAVDSWLSQYNLLLGNFITDGYSTNQSKKLLWAYFVLATFFTNVMFLNMLIAIMSDTFAKITEHKVKYALKERTQLYADYIYAVKLNSKLTKYRYLYVITPLEEEEGGQSEWSGGLSVIKSQIKADSQKLEGKVQAETTKIHLNIQDQALKLDNLQASVEQLQEAIWRLSNKFGVEQSKRELQVVPKSLLTIPISPPNKRS